MFKFIKNVINRYKNEKNSYEDQLEFKIICLMNERSRPDLDNLIAAEIIHSVRRHDKKHKWYRL